MIIGYNFMIETESGVLPAQAFVTLYQDDQPSWLSSTEHLVECQWIHPERHQLEVAALGDAAAEADVPSGLHQAGTSHLSRR